MRLVDIVSAPWAITPEMFSEVQGIYARHMRGEKIDIKEIEARAGVIIGQPRRDYAVDNGVAIIPVDGVLAKKMNLLMQISGGTSMQIIGNQVRAALADPGVNQIILNIDSPGGTVDGTQELANLIYGARGQKPIIALADGTMASAAYWIGSAADRIFISGDTTAVGSIGVVATHTDISGYEQKAGVKTTEITAGKYKRIASQYAPLSEEGRADIQSKVDYLYSVFVDDVARNRGVSSDAVLANMADGRVFIGQQAIQAGLVDGVSTLDELIARAAAGEFDQTASETADDQGAGAAPKAEAKDEEAQMSITVEQLKEEHPEVANALIAEGFAAGKAEGAEGERKRIQEVEAQAMPGHEELIASLKFDGKTTGAEAAVAVLKAEKERKAQHLEKLRADAPKAVPDAHADEAAEAAAAAADKGASAEKINPHEVATKARAYQAEMATKGIKVSAAEAVAHVTKEG